MIQGAYIKGCLWTQAGVLGESPSGLGDGKDGELQ